MRTHQLKDCRMPLSVMCLGAAPFGSTVPEETAFALMDQYVEAGGNVLDTANIYASWVPGGEGASERTIGKWLRKTGMREKIFLITKGGHPELKAINTPRLTLAHLKKDLEQSLERLGVDHIDLYFLHRDAPQVPVDEMLATVEEFRGLGVVDHVGASNWSWPRMELAHTGAERKGVRGFFASQICWSLARPRCEFQGSQGGLRSMDPATLVFHRRSRIPVFGYSAQANGFFSGKYSWDKGMPPSNKRAREIADWYYTQENVVRYRRACALALERDCSANTLALATLWCREFPGFAIIGPRTPEQLEDSLKAADVYLTAKDISFLDGRAPVDPITEVR